MAATVSQLMIGFSLFSAAILLIAYWFFLKDLRKTTVGLIACTVLLIAVSALQLSHWFHWRAGFEPVESRLYLLFLLMAPPAVYFFSKAVLLPDRPTVALESLHLLPPVVGALLPPHLSMSLAFAVGAGYTIWFARFVFGMRRHISRFRFEMFFFGLFAAIAVLALLVVLLIPVLGNQWFYWVYANGIGVSFVLIVGALIIYPDLLSDVRDAAQLAYAKSTLGDVDVDQTLKRLDDVLVTDKLFQNENLNLAMVADAVELSAHQLSELINRHKGCGFSRYMREIRVTEAKRLLREDRTSSVLAIGLMTGFRSQSTFYAAFREVTGQSPGNYRKAQSSE